MLNVLILKIKNMNNLKFKILSLLLLLVLVISCKAEDEINNDLENDDVVCIGIDYCVSNDALGRETKVSDVSTLRKGKIVGMFYWPWHIMDKFINVEPVNISDVIDKYPEAKNDYYHGAWKSVGRHHWNEPLFGYYISTDRWVLRKHAEMLADAGIDVVFFDCSNGDSELMWDEAIKVLGEVWCAAKNAGLNVPYFAFLTSFTQSNDSKDMIEGIYNEFYKKGLFKDLWFKWDGKPLILGYNGNLNSEVRDFFTFRTPRGSYKPDNSSEISNQWGWSQIYPQHGFCKNISGEYEQTTVSVAVNATEKLWPAAMNSTDQVFGRSYVPGKGMDNSIDAVNKGLHFEMQWEKALEIDPKLIFVTGWNEWVAGRYEIWQGTENAFPDQFNQEYSRDIEPMKGGHGDNYYYQLVQNVKKFKGLPKFPKVSPAKTIDIDGDFIDWFDVSPIYTDYIDSEKTRKSRGYGSKYYSNNTLRNDIIQSRVTHDKDNFYFYVKTVDAISQQEDKWMMLFINIDSDYNTGWNGYDFVLNRKKRRNGFSMLELSKSGWNWEDVAEVNYCVSNNEMEVAIPKKYLGVNEQTISIEFKWVDNMQEDDNIMDFYVNGDAAPNARFNFYYPVK